MKKLTAEQYAKKYMDAPFAALNESEALDFPLPKRERVSHKYSYGRALMIAGSRGFAGAPVLAAFRSLSVFARATSASCCSKRY